MFKRYNRDAGRRFFFRQRHRNGFGAPGSGLAICTREAADAPNNAVIGFGNTENRDPLPYHNPLWHQELGR